MCISLKRFYALEQVRTLLNTVREILEYVIGNKMHHLAYTCIIVLAKHIQRQSKEGIRRVNLLVYTIDNNISIRCDEQRFAAESCPLLSQCVWYVELLDRAQRHLKM